MVAGFTTTVSGLRPAGIVLVAGLMPETASNSEPVERARSTITHSQWVLSARICSSFSTRNPCSRKGVSTHGRSRSATNMPTLRSVVNILEAMAPAFYSDLRYVPHPMLRILQGVRVLDLTRVLAGPWCTQNLADLGAEVIKIERPGKGDDTRSWGPPFLKDREGRDTTDAAYYLACNRGKKSVTLDIASEEGRRIARSLALSADVLVENFKVGDLARHGLDYASLAGEHPRLVYCSITGFGQDGPYRDRPGYDFMVQGLGGLMSVTGERDDLPGGGPQKVGVAVSDLFTGMYATSAILAALVHRATSGRGQHIDMALLDVQVAMLANLSSTYFVSGEAPARMGNAHQNIVPYHVFRASDEFLIVAVGNDSQFAKFCEVVGAPEWPADPRFATNPQRVRHGICSWA